jgi:hypothetical protein
MTCTTPISLLSFEAQMRDWFTGLVENAGGDAIAVQAQLETIGLPADQAAAMAAALITQPETAQSFAAMPLTDLLQLVPAGRGLHSSTVKLNLSRS